MARKKSEPKPETLVERVTEQSLASVAAITESAIATAESRAERAPLLDGLRKVLLASIGGWTLAWNEVEDFVNRLVERGEIAEKDARTLLREMAEKRRPAQPEKAVEDVLHQMNIPSKDDIDALSAKITLLTKKVEELKKAQA